MRTLALVIVIVALAAVGYVLFLGREAADPPATETETPAETSEVETPAPSEEPATPEPAQTAEDVVNEVTESATQAAEEAVEAVTGVAEGAVEAAQDAVNQAVEGAADSVQEAIGAATDVTGTASDPSGTGQTSEAGAGPADLLTVESFDFDRVVEMIDGSDLGALQKTTLKTGLEQARENPELLQGVLDQVRAAIGL